MTKNLANKELEQNNYYFDQIAVFLVTLTTGIISFYFDVYEKLAGKLRLLEKFEIDELLPALFVFLISLSWLSFRKSKVLAKTVLKCEQTEDKLKKKEKKYRTIFFESPMGIFIYDHQGIITDCNEKFIETLGISKEQGIGLNLPGQINDKNFIEAVIESLEKGESSYEGFYVSFFSNKKIYVKVSLKGLRNEKNEIVSGIALIEDLTATKLAGRALEISEEKYRSMMEALDDAVCICSPDFRIEYMNPAMVKETGREATGEFCYKVLYGKDKKCSKCVYEAVQDGKHVKNDITNTKTGNSYHCSNSPVLHADGTISMLNIFRNVTKIKKMEAQLQQAQKMETIGELAGGIAHDFNNILFPITGYTELLLADAEEGSILRKNLEGIYSGAMRAKDLIQQILTFSRQNNEELKLIKIQPVINEVLRLIRATIPSTIEIEQNISADCGIIKADPTKIHQVMMNLTTNAYHAMEDKGGSLKISLKEIEFGEYDMINPDITPGTYACITVADTGIGMDKETIGKVFDPFFTTKKKGKGTGMGLSVVHGIVKGIDGAVNVYSEPGEGTEFNIYLPVIVNESETQKKQPDEVIQGGTERILLVDDEEAILKMEKQMLERLGYHVSLRISSIEAIEAVRAMPDNYDLVITDLAMPKKSGKQLITELKKIRPDMPILLCTGFSNQIPIEKALAMGINEVLMKPVVMKDLSKKIREVLDK